MKKHIFIIDNNHKCFLSSKYAHYNDFWRIMDTEDWSNDTEIHLWKTKANLNCYTISYFYCFYYIFGQIRAAVVA